MNFEELEESVFYILHNDPEIKRMKKELYELRKEVALLQKFKDNNEGA